MYITFDKNGKEQLRYFMEELPTDFKKEDYVKLKSEDDIPVKAGYTERATLVNGELVWEYEEMEISDKESIEALKEKMEAKGKTISELQAQMSTLSDTLDFVLSQQGGDK